jgi:hypothetical protein
MVQLNCVDTGEEVREGGEGVGLMVQRKCPRVVSTITEDNHVILVTRDTENRGDPEITVYEVKGLDISRRGTRKRQQNMLTELTYMI